MAGIIETPEGTQHYQSAVPGFEEDVLQEKRSTEPQHTGDGALQGGSASSAERVLLGASLRLSKLVHVPQCFRVVSLGALLRDQPREGKEMLVHLLLIFSLRFLFGALCALGMPICNYY